MRIWILLLSLTFSACTSQPVHNQEPCLVRSPAQAAPRCDAVFDRIREPQIRYAAGYENVKGRHLQYGFETEYTWAESAPLLDIYIPDPSITGVSAPDWLAMPMTKRRELIAEYENKIFPQREPAAVFLMTDNAALRAVLPKKIILDSGRFELVLPPRDSLEQIFNDIDVINKYLGTGSMQLTISSPRPERGLSKSEKREFARKTLGHLNFVNDRDVLEKLHSGFLRAKIDPSIPAASSFNHPWLGPMTLKKQSRLKKWIALIGEGEEVSRQHMELLSTEISSSKFIGGVAFRPDVAAYDRRIAFEIRNCHKSMGCLEQLALRETRFLQRSAESKESDFADLEAFNAVGLYDQLPSPVRKMLKDLFPRYSDYEEGLVDVEVFRNFTYPLKDWSPWIGQDQALQSQVSKSQMRYLARLKDLAETWEKRDLTEDEAQRAVMLAVSEFPSASGLLKRSREIEASIP